MDLQKEVDGLWSMSNVIWLIENVEPQAYYELAHGLEAMIFNKGPVVSNEQSPDILQVDSSGCYSPEKDFDKHSK